MVAIFNVFGIDGVPSPLGRCHLALSRRKLRRRLEAAEAECQLPSGPLDIFLHTLEKDALATALLVRNGIAPATGLLDGLLGTCRSRLAEHTGDIGVVWLLLSPVFLAISMPLMAVGVGIDRVRARGSACVRKPSMETNAPFAAGEALIADIEALLARCSAARANDVPISATSTSSAGRVEGMSAESRASVPTTQDGARTRSSLVDQATSSATPGSATQEQAGARAALQLTAPAREGPSTRGGPSRRSQRLEPDMTRGLGKAGMVIPLFVATQSAAVGTMVPKLAGSVLGGAAGLTAGVVHGLWKAARHRPQLPANPVSSETCHNDTTLIEQAPLSSVPAQYFYRTSDAWGFDVRELVKWLALQPGKVEWANPYTRVPLAPDDTERLMAHPSGHGKRLRKSLERLKLQGNGVSWATVDAMTRLAAVLANDDGQRRSVEALISFRDYYATRPARERAAVDALFEAATGEKFSAVAEEVIFGNSCSSTFGTALKGALKHIAPLASS